MREVNTAKQTAIDLMQSFPPDLIGHFVPDQFASQL